MATTDNKLEKVSIGHGCPRQNAIQKKVQHEDIIKVDMGHTQFTIWNLVKGR